jgi:hypothetical protein
MKLSDAVSHLHLPIFAEVPLLIFLGVFIGVALHVLRRSEQFQELSTLPLRDERAGKKQP